MCFPTSFRVLAILTTSLACAVTTRAEVRLPSVFSDHMVIQRDRPVPVWGWAAPRDRIEVSLGGSTAATEADEQGRWQVYLPAMPLGPAVEMSVVGPDNAVTRTDILIGDVWLCSGQSNMQWPVSATDQGAASIAAADFPEIRLFDIPRVARSTPQDDVNAQWKPCSPETVPAFSAVGFYFGRELHQELGIPIGVINSSWGGTRIEPWTPPIGFEQVPALADIARRVELADPASQAHADLVDQTIAVVQDWIRQAREATEQVRETPPIPTTPQGLVPLARESDPVALYNAMIFPVVPYALRGALWYQGESNHNEGMLYTEKMRALIQGWRTVWGQGVFPFYYVQIAPFQYGEEAPEIMAEFWEAQTAALEIPETGMVVVSDIGDLQDIHPKNKTDVAKRLALIALAKEYGREGIVYSGPHFQRMETDGRSLRLYFDHVGTGLASRDGEALDNFEIGGENGYFVPAEARIDGDTVLVSSPEVEAPTAVRFAWHKLATPNLMNREGLPALPFRSGTLPTRAILDKLLPELADWELLYSVDAPTQADDAITYEEDHHQEVNGTIDRVGYFLMLQKGETEPQYVFVTMSPFSDDPAMLGVPTAASGAVFQQRVGTIGVRSNVPGITTGEEAGEGYIEFWPHNYGPTNSAGVPGASNAVYDWGDTYSDPVKGYGSMQVHNLSAPQVVFAFNNWRSGASGDAGIGTSTGEQKDWTFSRNVGSYKTVKLQVLVKYAE